MIKKRIYFLFLLLYFSANSNAQNRITGEIPLHSKEKDTIVFFNGTLNTNYYEIPSISSPIQKTNFEISENFNYPHLYVQVLTSVRHSIFFKSSFLFLDNTTTKITIDKNIIHTENDGKTQKEFNAVFVPFMKNNEEKPFFKYTRSESLEFDERLLKYVEKYPTSYVALWFVAQRNKNNGNNIIHKQILSLFSNDVKESKLWINLSKDINKVSIHLESPFPSIILKSKELVETKLEIKKNEFTLIDFWFSTCKPCIEEMPKIKSLYDQYKSKGFNVISISTDKEKNIEFWKTQMINLEMNWENYLDLNGEIAKQNNITFFPTTFLIDKNGVIIKKNIELTALEELLKKEL